MLSQSAQNNPIRQWRASLSLHLKKRGDKTVIAKTDHFGPLRIQRPFYPEVGDCCHIYILHPPGGMVMGDELQVMAHLHPNTCALLTTPSAAKLYSSAGTEFTQKQKTQLLLEAGASVEWLPQETIVFNGAQGELFTRIQLAPAAKVLGWDIIRLGRAASGEKFNAGYCNQTIELWRDAQPLYIERNRFGTNSPLLNARWGCRGANTVATLFATVALNRDDIEQLAHDLDSRFSNQGGMWGLSQKGELLLARYLGNSITDCRRGLEYVWQQLRPPMIGKVAVQPRIWNT